MNSQLLAADELREICYFLETKDILTASRVCKEWNDVIDDIFWRFLCTSRYHVTATNIINWKVYYVKLYLGQSAKPQAHEFVTIKSMKCDRMYDSIKLVVLGDGSVGKTCTLITYATNSFPEDFVPTKGPGNVHMCDIWMDGQCVSMSLWDTAGQDEYDNLRSLSYPDTSLPLVMYSVLSPTSFERVKEKWIPEIRRDLPRLPWILVGNKIDGRPEWAEKGKPFVSTSEGLELAKKEGAVGFFEVSAKQLKGLRELFMFASRVSVMNSIPGAIVTSTTSKETNMCNIQ